MATGLCRTRFANLDRYPHFRDTNGAAVVRTGKRLKKVGAKRALDYPRQMRRLLRWLRQPLPPANALHRKHFTNLLVALAACAAVGAYILDPIIRFADRGLMFTAAMLTIFGFHAGFLLTRKQETADKFWIAVIMLACGAATFFWVGLKAEKASMWHDARCLRIQAAMFRPTEHTRDDLPELFAALDCRPQGEGPEEPNLSDSVGGPPNPAKVEAFQRLKKQMLESEILLDAPAKEDRKKSADLPSQPLRYR